MGAAITAGSFSGNYAVGLSKVRRLVLGLVWRNNFIVFGSRGGLSARGSCVSAKQLQIVIEIPWGLATHLTLSLEVTGPGGVTGF